MNETTNVTLAEAFGSGFESSGKWVGHPSITIDSKGNFHVIYIHWSNDDWYNQSIMYTMKKETKKPPIMNQSDTDSDSLPDSWEIQYFGNLSQNASGDFDSDGKNNLQEYKDGTDPTKAPAAPQPGNDTDSDGLPDPWEIQYFGDLSQDAGDDYDNDGLINMQEYLRGTSPIESAIDDKKTNGDDQDPALWMILILIIIIVLVIIVIMLMIMKKKPTDLPGQEPSPTSEERVSHE